MRPIDADALKEKIGQCGGEGTIARYCKRVLAECLDNDAPTIDVIPMEWLHCKRKEALQEGVRPDEVDAVEMVLWMWQKEQEERDNG